jgi:hypothetical protein
VIDGNSPEFTDEGTPQIGCDTNKDFMTDPNNKFRYDMENAPIGTILFLLSHPSGVAHKAKLTGRKDRDSDIVAWCKLPDRDKEEEARRGLFSNNYKPTKP